MDIYVQSEIGTCSEFMSAGVKEQVSIVVAPLRVEENESGRLKMVMGCNMWKSCQNARCQFSLLSHSKK